MRLKAVVATVSFAALLAACGGASATPTPAPATPAPTVAPAATPAPATSAPASPATPASPAAGAAKVSANTATADELIAALTAAGVSNAERWADEIEEYRPYDASDTNLDKLRGELAKYNPDQETLDAILSVLRP